jgi:hypothetical protein
MGDAIFLFIRKIFHDLFIIGDFFRRSEEQRFWADGQFVLYYSLYFQFGTYYDTLDTHDALGT